MQGSLQHFYVVVNFMARSLQEKFWIVCHTLYIVSLFSHKPAIMLCVIFYTICKDLIYLKDTWLFFFHSLGPRILAILCSMVTRYFWWRRWKFSYIFSHGTEENNERYVAVYQPLLFYPARTPWSSFNIKLYSHLFLSVQPLSCAVSTGIDGQPV